MKIRYDLHIHSGLSPCADNDMSPINILAMASVKGLNMIAVADHNGIGNVAAAIEIGKLLKIEVVPAMELQTSEDIHILCLFGDYTGLERFYGGLKFQKIKNNEQIFGEQIIYDEDGNAKAYEEYLLLTSGDISSHKVNEMAKTYGGVAVPAHIDRDANGMLNILGAVDEQFETVELSKDADTELIKEYEKRGNVIFDSDAHSLADIGIAGGIMNLKKNTAVCLIESLRNKNE